MDRWIVAGFVAVLLATPGGSASAQSVPSRDPSDQPAVGIAPIRSLYDSINSVQIPANPGVVPIASSRLPISPVGSGPPGVVPRPPVLDEPVSMAPIDPIQQSLSRGFDTGRVASIFRKQGTRPITPASASTPSRFLIGTPPGVSSRGFQPPSTAATEAPAQPTPKPRPAPRAGDAPEMARPQADPVVAPASATTEGRPSPFARVLPPNARPQAPDSPRSAEPRPRVEAPAPTGPRPSTVEPPAPVAEPSSMLPPAPTLEDLPTLPVPIPINPGPAGAIAAPVETSTLAPPTLPSADGLTTPTDLPALEPVQPTPPPTPTPPGPSTTTPTVAEPPPPGLPELVSLETATPAVLAPRQAPTVDPSPSAPAVPDLLGGSPMMVDDQVRRTSDSDSAMQLKDKRTRRELNFLTFRAAAVGDEIITINELKEAVKLQMADYGSSADLPPNSPQYKMLMNQVAATTLNHLIDQRLILQEARGKIAKNPKAEQAFNDFIDGIWKTEELAPMHRKYGTNNVHELRAKLKSEGKNYDTLKEAFRKREMAKQFLNGEIRNHVTCDLLEQKAYYTAHVSEFEKPARITWREIEVNVGRYPDRASARKKADELLARLLHDESFEAIARSSSHGPTASQGGLYTDMQPGSYGIPSVNDELNRLPIGQVSQVIEAPNSFHIIRVESRREKGPLHFAEVQDAIKSQVLMDNYQKAVNRYLARLRSKTLIRTMFEQTDQGLVAAGSSTSND